VFRLPSSWVWDFWLADDSERFHLFFLKASRALHDADRRHWSAIVGHAVSDDLREWTEVADALVPSDGPAFDDLATWTGSVLQAPDGTWRMFYTGVDRTGKGLVQRIGGATSTDLHTWHRIDGTPLTAPDPAWYEQLTDEMWQDEAWRDPWVFPDPDGDGWHMLITARANEGERRERGVVGYAHSHDLHTWTVGPPLSAPGAGFGQLEVLQVAEVEGRGVLLFSCQTGEMSEGRVAGDGIGGIWAVNVDKLTGPYDVAAAYRLHDESLYVGRLVQERSGQWVLLAFRNLAPELGFVGEITDPMPVRWGSDGRLRLG
jgi:beta-fructofuranosidase